MNATALGRISEMVAEQLRRLLRRIGRDRSREELLAMDERELRDIAIGRGEIPYLLSQRR